MGGIIMNENLDLTKILDGCPEGTMFYHSNFGYVSLKGIQKESEYPIKLLASDNYCASVTSEGLNYKEYNGECILFPAKDQRDWSKFERFWDKPKVEKFDVNTLRPFDKVLVRSGDNKFWTAGFFSYIVGQWVICVGGGIAKCIPYNEETKHLIGTAEDCPEYYKWWEK